MSRAVIIAALIASIHEAAGIAATDAAAAGADGKAGLPWAARASVEATRLLDSPEAVGKPFDQLQSVESFVLQPWPAAWIHLGLTSRLTQIPEASFAYREPALLEAAGNVEAVPGFLYAGLGVVLPLWAETAALEDSLAIYRFLNVYRRGLRPVALPTKTFFGGIYARQRLSSWELLSGLSFGRSALFDMYAGHSFTPPTLLNGSFRLLFHGQALYRLDIAATYFGRERDQLLRAAHQEGALLGFRYGLRQALGRVGLDVGLGGSLKLADRNRRTFLGGQLPDAGENDNTQRLFADATLIWRMRPHLLAQVFARPVALYHPAGGEWGYELELFQRTRWRAGWYHDVEFAPGIRIGRYGDFSVLAVTARLEYAFHHLPGKGGFQGMEAGEGL